MKSILRHTVLLLFVAIIGIELAEAEVEVRAVNATVEQRGVQVRSVDFTTGQVELYNYGLGTPGAVDLSGWRLCTHDSSVVRRYTSSTGLNGISLGVGKSLVIDFSNTINDEIVDGNVFRKVSSLGGTAATLNRAEFIFGIYVATPFSDGDNIADHLQWSTDGVDVDAPDDNQRSQAAQDGGVWADKDVWLATAADTETIVLNDSAETVINNIAANFTVSGPITGAECPDSLLINELDADTNSVDMLEFVELFDGGAGSTALDGCRLLMFNGSDSGNDSAYEAFDLAGQTTDANGYFVLGNSAVENVDLIFDDGTLQNGADAVGIYNSSTITVGAKVTTTNLISALVYDTDDDDDSGLLTGLGENTQYDEDENGNKDTESIQRTQDGSRDNDETYFVASPTPGEINSVPTAVVLNSSSIAVGLASVVILSGLIGLLGLTLITKRRR